jgi:hypothetical protein
VTTRPDDEDDAGDNNDPTSVIFVHPVVEIPTLDS